MYAAPYVAPFCHQFYIKKYLNDGQNIAPPLLNPHLNMHVHTVSSLFISMYSIDIKPLYTWKNTHDVGSPRAAYPGVISLFGTYTDIGRE